MFVLNSEFVGPAFWNRAQDSSYFPIWSNQATVIHQAFERHLTDCMKFASLHHAREIWSREKTTASARNMRSKKDGLVFIIDKSVVVVFLIRQSNQWRKCQKQISNALLCTTCDSQTWSIQFTVTLNWENIENLKKKAACRLETSLRWLIDYPESCRVVLWLLIACCLSVVPQTETSWALRLSICIYSFFLKNILSRQNVIFYYSDKPPSMRSLVKKNCSAFGNGLIQLFLNTIKLYTSIDASSNQCVESNRTSPPGMLWPNSQSYSFSAMPFFFMKEISIIWMILQNNNEWSAWYKASERAQSHEWKRSITRTLSEPRSCSSAARPPSDSVSPSK